MFKEYSQGGLMSKSQCQKYQALNQVVLAFKGQVDWVETETKK